MRGISYVVTDKCNISCKFCAPECGPEFSSYLSSSDMIKVFDELNSHQTIPLVVFTGGEPMLFRREINDVIEHVYSVNSDIITRIVTNASWAVSLETAKQILGELKKRGISELNYSVDDFHQEFIPIERVRNAVEAAMELKIPVVLAHKTYPGSVSCKEFYEEAFERPIKPLQDVSIEDFKKELLFFSSGYTLPLGRGSSEIDKSAWLSDSYSDDRWKGPCSEVLSSYNISADGFLIPCCGLVSRNLEVFYAGSALSENVIDVMERASSSTLYNWLALEGPSAIMEYVKSKDSSLEFKGKYMQACELCQELFSNKRVLTVVKQNLDEIGWKLGILRSIYEALRAIPKKQEELSVV